MLVSRTLAVAARHLVPVRRGWVTIHPRWRARFSDSGLSSPADFLDLPGEVVGGHANRHVVRVRLDLGGRTITAYLKREHRLDWTDRVTGDSHSQREARVLRSLARGPVPRWLAYGRDCDGRAFLLVRGESRASDLRSILHAGLPSGQRRRLAVAVGRAVAAVHRAGFVHPDLTCKHILIQKHYQLTLLDWARGRKSESWRDRARDLTVLHASLADELASSRERLLMLRAYCRHMPDAPPEAELAEAIAAAESVALRRRSVRELRQPPCASGRQRLRWLRGEALCVTRPAWRLCGGSLPPELDALAEPFDITSRSAAAFAPFGRVEILRFAQVHWLTRLWAEVRGTRPTARAVILAGAAFRLHRYGVSTARVWAFGQHADGSGFLLTERFADALPAWDALARNGRAAVLLALGQSLRRAHDAGFHAPPGDWAVRPGREGVTLTTCCHLRPANPKRDLPEFLRELGPRSPKDVMRFARGYFGRTDAVRRLVRSLGVTRP